MERDHRPMTLIRSNTRGPLAVAILAFLCLSLVRAETYGQARERALTKPNRHVNDFGGVIDAATTQQLESALINLKQRTGIEFVIAIIKTAGDQDLYGYSIQV